MYSVEKKLGSSRYGADVVDDALLERLEAEIERERQEAQENAQRNLPPVGEVLLRVGVAKLLADEVRVI